MKMEVLKQMNWRYATKKFDPSRKVSEENLNTILESLRLTPSSFGMQPWKFVVVEDGNTRKDLRKFAGDQPQITDSSHLIVLCTRNDIDNDLVKSHFENVCRIRGEKLESYSAYMGKVSGFFESMPEQAKICWKSEQVYIALGSILAILAQMRIDSCPIAGFDKDGFDEVLGLKELGISSCLLCPIGYRSEEDKYSRLEKIRFPLEDIIIYK